MAMKRLVAAVTAAGLLTLGVAGTAGALEGDGTPNGSGGATTEQHRHHPRRAVLRIAAGAAAETIGVSLDELRDAVRSGQSAAALAESKGVDPDAVEQAVAAALTDAVDQAVADGRIADARAAKIRERIPGVAERLVNGVPKRFQDGGAAQT